MTTYKQLLIQIVFSSKHRLKFLNIKNESTLYRYLSAVLINKKCNSYKIGGYQNHVHIVSGLYPAISVSTLVRELKRSSHELMKREKALFSEFYGWQDGYGVFSYDISAKHHLVKYAENQKFHHQKKDLREEWIELLEEFEVEYDQRFLFD